MQTQSEMVTSESSTRAAKTTCTQLNGLRPLICHGGFEAPFFAARLSFNPHNLPLERTAGSPSLAAAQRRVMRQMELLWAE